jgi:hypothetical protein
MMEAANDSLVFSQTTGSILTKIPNQRESLPSDFVVPALQLESVREETLK